jgi:hypothetical protein
MSPRQKPGSRSDKSVSTFLHRFPLFTCLREADRPSAVITENALRRRRAGMTELMLFVLPVILCTAFIASAEGERSIRVIAGAESHGMIDACDCELEPGGGVAKRASLIASIRKAPGEILLLDAGGFSAGGIYDDYTEGWRVDSARTVTMLRAMARMGYDAVAVGDDDLQLGGSWLAERARKDSLPLVCANCFTGKKKLLFKPYRIIRRNNLRIAVTGVTTPEKLFPLDTSVRIGNPETALRAIWKEMNEKSDIQIILSHLGQEGTAALARAFPDVDLMVNGHRKTDKQPVTMIGTVPVLQFGFQGKSLSGLDITVAKKRVTAGAARWYDVVPELPDDPSFTTITKKNTEKPEAENTYDLYIMSMCPYGMEALGNFLTFLASDSSIVWRLWFIGTATADTTFSSLHGNDEVVDEMRWLAVQALYPGKWMEFLHRRTAEEGPTTGLFRKLEIDPERIKSWVDRHGKAELKKQYDRSTRLSINASPTLMVNNRPFSRAIIDGNLRRFHCTATGNKLRMCASLPECVEDTDCRAPGKLGTCAAGKCERRDAVPFIFTVVVADSTMSHPENKVIATTRELFPGAEIQTVTARSQQGKKLIANYRVKMLPFYLFGREVTLTHNYSSIEKGLVDLGGAYTFQEGIVPVNYLIGRKARAGKTVLYIDPFFQGLPDIFALFKADTALSSSCDILPLLFENPKEVRRGTEGMFRQEEALRWLALGSMGKKTKWCYLSAYAEQPGSSYWSIPLAGCGVSGDSLQKAIARSADALASLWKECSMLSIREPAVLLLDNVELAVPGGERDLRRLLTRRKQ